MIYVINNNNSCFFNHAAEEYLMNEFDDEVFMLWINEPSILIGKNQNTLSEININYVREKDIKVVRRLSGGGSVYNDLGNINYSFITKRHKSSLKMEDGFKKFALPVINALESLGVDAIFTGRNDILIDGKKFSGNAQYFQKEKLLHHGTLLFDCDMTKLSLALKSKPMKFKGKSVKSVEGRVTNILPNLKEPMRLEEFKDYLKNYIIKDHKIDKIYEFTEKDIEEINKIVEKRFKRWEWNYARSPVYRYENAIKHSGGLVEYNLNVEEGIIKAISIYGDFFGEKNIKDIEEKLLGSKHSLEDIKERLKGLNFEDYMKDISRNEFIEGLIDVK